MKTAVIYRGPLTSCNYCCEYCPFAKQPPCPENLREDRLALARFVRWLAEDGRDEMGVQFTPRGEALIHPWYQAAMIRLSRLPHLWKVAIQTNLSCDLAWLERCAPASVGLWCTYHPGQVSRGDFLDRCARLDQLGVSYSVGVVGLREHFAEIAALRAALPRPVYLWINAYKSQGPYYSQEEIERLTAIDPLFPISTHRHNSRGKPCLCGESVFSVDGEGAVRRCHFVTGSLGNIYTEDLQQMGKSRPCPNETCGCHIGYIHMPELYGAELFGEGLLERAAKNAK